MRKTILTASILTGLSSCSTPGGAPPSLLPRAAEAIDPRAPVVRPLNDRPADPSLLAFLASAEARADEGEAAFAPAIARAGQLAAAAGARQSESWIAAEEALSAAIAAREPTARALGDVDAAAAARLKGNGGIAPSDLASIQRTAGRIAAIDRRQVERIDAIKQRLGN